MTARDELAQVIRAQASRGQYQMPGESLPYEQWSRSMADTVHAAGWRKMPSKRDLLRLTTQLSMDGAGPMAQADAILALMDGDNE